MIFNPLKYCECINLDIGGKELILVEPVNDRGVFDFINGVNSGRVLVIDNVVLARYFFKIRPLGDMGSPFDVQKAFSQFSGMQYAGEDEQTCQGRH
jgi:hypothetical protein